MKNARLICIPLLALVSLHLHGQSLTLTNYGAENLRLRLEVMQQMKSFAAVDSLAVSPGETKTMRKKEPHVSFYRVVQADKPDQPFIEFIWDENVTVTLDSTLGMRVEGSARTDAWRAYLQEVVDPGRRVLIESTMASNRLRQMGDSLGAIAHLEKNNQLISNINQQFYRLSHTGQKDFLYLYWLAREWIGLGLPATKSLLAEFSPEWHGHPLYVAIQEEIRNIESVGEGVKIAPFTGTTLPGTPLNLSGVESEYVLLDFWGSWCGPCIQAIPKLKSLLTTFPTAKLSIIGIAAENTLPSNALRKTIESKMIFWPQIEELRGGSETLVDRFHITFFPTYILLNKNLTIVKRGGPEVLQDIKDLLNK